MTPDDVEQSYRHCRRIVQQAKSNLAWTFFLLPSDQRRGLDALYAFARLADDLADGADPSPLRRQRLAHFSAAVASRLAEFGPCGSEAAAIAEGPFSCSYTGPLAILPALADTVARFHIDPSRLLELLRGVTLDLDHHGFATLDELRRYCYLVASSVGLACLPIWGCRDAAAVEPAIDCGLAFQLTNILRDLAEDCQRGRVYLPTEELARFGVAAADLGAGSPTVGFHDLLQFQFARAESFYESGADTARFLPKPGRRVFRLMFARYWQLLKRIKERGADVLNSPARLTFPRKLLLAAAALATDGPPRDLRAATSQPRAAETTREQLPSRAGCSPVTSPRVAIVGGGLAGLAAAAALCQRGFRVELFEAKRRLGGRAGSFLDKATGELFDHCQHVAMGCCTNFLDFCRQTGIHDLLATTDTLHFIGPDGECCRFQAARWLPAPLHLFGALQQLRYLSPADRRAIASGLLQLGRATRKDNSLTIGAWLDQQRQPPVAIELFWKAVLVSALGESLDRASLTAARKVFVDGFLNHPRAYHLHIPRRSLAELYDQRVADWLRRRGVAIHLETPVQHIALDDEAQLLVNVQGSQQPFDIVIAALPWRGLPPLLSPPLGPALAPQMDAVARMQSAPISSVHLWFDRRITELPHVVIVGRLSQWLFVREPAAAGNDSSLNSGFYHQVVISASRELAGRDRTEIVREVCGDLSAIFPLAREARLLRSALLTEPEAVFSVTPASEALRPSQRTSIPGLILAGDWTSTGWPATMEGAVRSGYLAAQAALGATNRRNQILVPDLPRGWLSYLLFRPT